jgi:hypothetical protein
MPGRCPADGAHGVYGQSNLGYGVFGISFHGSGVVGQRPQTGVYIEGAQPANGSFTITLSKNASSPLPVAWFVLA